jgi:hypothetical protein
MSLLLLLLLEVTKHSRLFGVVLFVSCDLSGWLAGINLFVFLGDDHAMLTYHLILYL